MAVIYAYPPSSYSSGFSLLSEEDAESAAYEEEQSGEPEYTHIDVTDELQARVFAAYEELEEVTKLLQDAYDNSPHRIEERRRAEEARKELWSAGAVYFKMTNADGRDASMMVPLKSLRVETVERSIEGDKFSFSIGDEFEVAGIWQDFTND